MRAPLVLAMALVLAACNQGGAITCPTLKGYSSAFLSATAREFEGLDRIAPHITQMLNDYGVERDAVRECLRLQKRAKSTQRS